MKTHFRRKAVAASTSVNPNTVQYAPDSVLSDWERPAHWTDMGTPAANETFLLYRMTEDSVQPITVQITNAQGAEVTVQGDTVTYLTGTANGVLTILPSFATNTTPVAADGAKYCKVVIKPTTVNYTHLRLGEQAAGYPNATYRPSNAYVEIDANIPTLTFVDFGRTDSTSGRRNGLLEHIRLRATSPVIGAYKLFYELSSLRKITVDEGQITTNSSMSNMFDSCYLLRHIPKVVNTATVKKDAIRICSNCYSITEPPDLPYDKFNSGTYAFYGCTNLKTFNNSMLVGVVSAAYMFAKCASIQFDGDIITLPAATGISFLFNECNSMVRVNGLYAPSVSGSGASSVFAYSAALTYVGTVTLGSAAYVVSNFFYNCFSLVRVDSFIAPGATDIVNLCSNCTRLRSIGAWQLSPNLANASNAFYYCSQLEYVPPLTAPYITGVSFTFYYCLTLKVAPAWTLMNQSDVNCTSMFSNCSNLVDASPVVIGFIKYGSSLHENCSSLTKTVRATTYGYSNAANNFAYNCVALQKLPTPFAMSNTFSVANSGMTAEGLNALFTALPNAYMPGSSTVQILNTPGSATCNRTIATDKGWLVSG